MAARTLENHLTLAIATQNPDKIKEISHELASLPVKLIPQPPDYRPPLELGTTCEENALTKARSIAMTMNLPALADDSGLFVDVLNGEPGVHSSRFAGSNATYADNVNKLLHMMQGVAEEDRTATFVCIIAIVWPHGRFELIRGECYGIITTEPRGTNGFGYDPVFYYPDLGRTFAQMTLEEKNKVSHRGRALIKLRNRLSKYINNLNEHPK